VGAGAVSFVVVFFAAAFAGRAFSVAFLTAAFF
jgi:hypothetical protein